MQASPSPQAAPAPVVVTQDTVPSHPNTARNAIVFFFAMVLLFLLGRQLLKELEIIYVSALFAVVLTPSVRWITDHRFGKYKPSKSVAVVVMLFTVIVVLGLFIVIAVPPVLKDLRNFISDVPQRLPVAVAHIKKLPLADKFGVDQVAAKAEGLASAVGGYIFSSLPLWLSHIFDLLTALFLCIYFMLEGEHAYSFFLSLIPSSRRNRLDNTLRKAEGKMSKWLFGQGLLMLTLGVTSTIVFGLLHVRYFILLGVLMGLLNIIPIAGGVIVIVLAAGVAALDSWQKMAAVFAFYAIYMNIENAFLTPRIMRSSVDLMGLTVLVALLLGTALAGIVGALVAVPTAALISVLLDEYAVQPA